MAALFECLPEGLTLTLRYFEIEFLFFFFLYSKNEFAVQTDVNQMAKVFLVLLFNIYFCGSSPGQHPLLLSSSYSR